MMRKKPGLPARVQLLRPVHEFNAGQGRGQRKDDVGRPNVATLRSTLLSLTPRCRVLADGPFAGPNKPDGTNKPKPPR